MGLVTGAASAQENNNNCAITGSGPGSINTCTFDDTNNLTIVCDNGTIVTTDNNQSGNTGTVVVDNNGKVGGASSGNASNTNETIVNLAAYCGTTVAVTPTPVTPPAPTPEPTPTEPTVMAAQVTAKPVGAVNAGAGYKATSNLTAIAGILGSVAIALGGFMLVRKFNK